MILKRIMVQKYLTAIPFVWKFVWKNKNPATVSIAGPLTFLPFFSMRNSPMLSL
jgi:hypothetical protein